MDLGVLVPDISNLINNSIFQNFENGSSGENSTTLCTFLKIFEKSLLIEFYISEIKVPRSMRFTWNSGIIRIQCKIAAIFTRRHIFGNYFILLLGFKPVIVLPEGAHLPPY